MRPAVKSFLKRFEKNAETPESPEEKVENTKFDQARKSDTIFRFFYELSWTRWQQWEIYAASCLLLIAVIAVWIAVLQTGTKPPIEIYPERNTRELVERGFGDGNVNQDQVAKFIIDTLSLLHRLDDNGNPYLPLLRGYINPAIYDQVDETMSRNLNQLRESGIVQNLNVTRILKINQDGESGRISAYVRGYYSIFKEPQGNQTEVRLIPYRARVKLEPNIRSEVNSTEFYLFELREITGAQTETWDREEGL